MSIVWLVIRPCVAGAALQTSCVTGNIKSPKSLKKLEIMVQIRQNIASIPADLSWWDINNRPGIARAVLQTPTSLIY